ncbi:2-phospho-L-lactate guanylyltransferase [Novosphingobium sp. FGD1]|jgi:2-phospho-L-lactate guanylyltransferase|uniref:3-phospho-D-glycerate guanylyltransferase n=1 Tax=Novosphingobium silvae TaxID=2692619 RepID=A0A7X4K783_9SPHN|nr:2-phospho-L-lactate guanylyltransferase [Novosphingobium silvae]MYL97013.1 2-phospho-L-lactate guanylyltransferase [Novosphingobium silvae]
MTLAAATWVLIPVKARGAGKTRLAALLSAAERESLVEAMLEHVVDVTQAQVARIVIIGPERGGIAAHLERFEDPGGGLNAALEHGRRGIASRSDAPERLIVLPADLPCLVPDDVARLRDLAAGAVGIAPDRHGHGTNALSLPLPAAARFRFRFGPDSAALHRLEAEILRLSVVTITTPGLEKDIDEHSDLADAAHMFSPAS